MTLNEVFNDMLQDSKGEIHMTVDGYAVNGTIKGDAGSVILTIRALITNLAQNTGKTEAEIMEVVNHFMSCSQTFKAESKEQLDVMVEIINKM